MSTADIYAHDVLEYLAKMARAGRLAAAAMEIKDSENHGREVTIKFFAPLPERPEADAAFRARILEPHTEFPTYQQLTVTEIECAMIGFGPVLDTLGKKLGLKRHGA